MPKRSQDEGDAAFFSWYQQLLNSRLIGNHPIGGDKDVMVNSFMPGQGSWAGHAPNNS